MGGQPVFDRIMIVDWSARGSRSPKRPSPDAIWIATAEIGQTPTPPVYLRTRAAAEAFLAEAMAKALSDGARLLIGCDFPFGYPAGFAAHLTGQPEALALWQWLAERVEDGPDNRNNRFALAAAINRGFPGVGPFWGCPVGQTHDGLPARGTERTGHGLPERRAVETVLRSAQPCWKLYTTGSVGSQVLLGLPVLERLRRQFGQAVTVWPFEDRVAPITLAEIYPSLLSAEVAAAESVEGGIKDAHQVRLLAQAFARQGDDGWRALFDTCPQDEVVRREEGWVLGAGAVDRLRS